MKPDQSELRAQRRQRQRGSSITEFALISIVLFPLMMGSYSVGMSLAKSIQAGVVARDAGAMFMRYVDFTLASNKALLVRIASGMNMTATGGNGVVILSQVMKIGDQQCTDAGLTGTACTNRYQTVIIKRVTVGNTSLLTSAVGTPSASIITSDGTITATNYLKNTSAVATNFDNASTCPATPTTGKIMCLIDGSFAYVAEAYFRTPEIDLPGSYDNTGVYQRNIF